MRINRSGAVRTLEKVFSPFTIADLIQPDLPAAIQPERIRPFAVELLKGFQKILCKQLAISASQERSRTPGKAGGFPIGLTSIIKHLPKDFSVL